jgi:hypothetical protein
VVKRTVSDVFQFIRTRRPLYRQTPTCTAIPFTIFSYTQPLLQANPFQSADCRTQIQ